MAPLIPSIGATLRTLRHVPFQIYLWLLLAFMLVNASAIAPAGRVEHFQTILIVYMILMLVFVRMSPKIRGLKMNLNQAIIWFVAPFVATTIIMTGLMGFRGLEVPAYAVGAATYLILIHTCVVSFCEEEIFRGALTNILTAVPAAAAFAIFHWGAYQAGPMAMLTAFIAGLVFYIIYRYTNIWCVAGLHAGYNVAIIGVLGVL